MIDNINPNPNPSSWIPLYGSCGMIQIKTPHLFRDHRSRNVQHGR